MTHSIGIIQGRLLPPVGERVQAFPGIGWEREFEIAADIGFDSIELTVEMASWNTHPVRTPAGRRALRNAVSGSGVGLAGLCCDTFMEVPLVATDEETRKQGAAILETTLDCAAEAGLPMVELPMLGANGLSRATADTLAEFGRILDSALRRAEIAGVDILLEADLAPLPYADFIAAHDHAQLGINYDMGNSTWFGFDPREEIRAYHHRIRNVHVKDCTRKDYSVPLGTGETEMEAVFSLLARHGYTGDFVLQAARHGEEISACRQYLALVRALIAGADAQHDSRHWASAGCPCAPRDHAPDGT